MSYFKTKMHQIRFRLRLCPRTRWGAYSAPQSPYLDLRALLLREGKGRVRASRIFSSVCWQPYPRLQSANITCNTCLKRPRNTKMKQTEK